MKHSIVPFGNGNQDFVHPKVSVLEQNHRAIFSNNCPIYSFNVKYQLPHSNSPYGIRLRRVAIECGTSILLVSEVDFFQIIVQHARGFIRETNLKNLKNMNFKKGLKETRTLPKILPFNL